jgi:spore coat protein A, manganese oxidase
MITRREFLKYAGIAGAAATLPLKIGVRSAQAYAISPGIQKFTVPMRGFLGGQIPLAGLAATQPYANVNYYEVTAGWFRDNLGANMVAAFPGYTGTRFYGYGSQGVDGNGVLVGGKHLGNGIVATKGVPVRIRLFNRLPTPHIIPFDASIPQTAVGTTVQQSHTAIHLHGGLVPWTSDGGPFHWIKQGSDTTKDATGGNGASLINWLPDNGGTLTNDYYYPNLQSGRLMWYHDHAVGITRISAYAGVAAPYIITDTGQPGSLDDKAGIPVKEYLVFQDKVFYSSTADPLYTTSPALGGGGITGALPGDLWYPYIYDPKIWKLQGSKNKKLPIPSCVAEMFGDTMLANGTPYPTYAIDATTLRFRLLNACNARFLNLQFVEENTAAGAAGEPLGGYLTPTVAKVDAWVIGTEGGYLQNPVRVLTQGQPNFINPLLMGPAERLDIVVDFTLCAGKGVLLYNDAAAPYPIGAPIFDFYPGNALNPGAAAIASGFGPNTRTIMKFAVGAVPSPNLPYLPNAIAPSSDFLSTVAAGALVGGLNLPDTTIGAAYTVRGDTYTFRGIQNLTLNESFDAVGRLMQLVGTTVPIKQSLGFGRSYIFDAPTENVNFNDVWIWNIYNLTADAHPMHVHEFNAMILSRRLFKVQNFNGAPVYTALGVGPTLTETGWKETFKMFPGEETKIAILVEDPLPVSAGYVRGSYPLPGGGNAQRPTVAVPLAGGGTPLSGTLPISPRLAALVPAVIGDEYVWHCHILEHEEHDMMRPLVCHYPGA